MLKDALEALAKMAVDAKQQSVKPFRAGEEPGHIYYLPQGDGPPKMVFANPQPRAHKALNLDTLARIANAHAELDDQTATVVWYSYESVVCLLDDTFRRDTVTVELERSLPFQKLEELSTKRQQLAQREILFLLRTTFKECLREAPDLVGVLRKVNFRTEAKAESEVRHQKASIGKSVESQLSGTADIPEYVTLVVPVFENPKLPWVFPVECALEPNPEQQTFQLFPLPGQMAKAEAEAADKIADLLREDLNEGIALYYGVP